MKRLADDKIEMITVSYHFKPFLVFYEINRILRILRERIRNKDV